MTRSTERARILVVDDAPATLEVIARNLAGAGFEVATAGNVAQAVAILSAGPVDLVLTDYRMPGGNGLDLVRHVRENSPDSEILMITGYPTIEGAVRALKTGAEDYLAKPFTDGELLAAVSRALAKLRARRLASAPEGAAPPRFQGFLGESPAMERVFRAIGRAAAIPATVLITGESGTGKELVARAIHYSGPRGKAPFVPVNCGSIPEDLLESELFGHVRGAFTGASESRAGFFQTADGGTIFLDEVSEASLAMQVKLLRVLNDREVCMVGSHRPRKVDVRVIAATNKDLSGLVRKGVFREDLFFRLNVIPVEVPPLRARGDDILRLIRHFAEKYAREAGKPAPAFSGRAIEVLSGYEWPGNVRELENIVQRLVVMTDAETVEVSDLPSLMRFSALSGMRPDRTLAAVESDYIAAVLAASGGNVSRAAKVLGIDRKTLREKMKKASPA